MTENDKRLDIIINKLTDDYFADGRFEQKIVKEDWLEIKPIIIEASKKAFGNIHQNIIPHIKFQKVLDEYEASGLIL